MPRKRFRLPDFALLQGDLSAPKSQRFLRFAIAMPIIARFPRQEKAMLHCDLRVRWKVASDLRFRAAISEPKTPSFCGISGDLAPSTRKSLAIAIVRFWCAKRATFRRKIRRAVSDPLRAGPAGNHSCEFPCLLGVCAVALLACDIVCYAVCDRPCLSCVPVYGSLKRVS